MKEICEAKYASITRTIQLEQEEIDLLQELCSRMNKWYEVRDFRGLEREKLEMLDNAGVISLRKGVIILENELISKLLSKN